jgi:cytochrome c553
MLGCANCHTTTGVQPGRPAKTLASLNTESDEGCLGPHVKKGLPQYHLSPDQVRALKAAVKDAPNLNKPLEPKEQVVRTIAAMNCYACHRRDNVGGPTPDRTELFTMKAEFDMGDEGRIPPQLTGVGFKLLPQAIERIVFQSELHVRPALATRMPRFKKEAMADFAQVVVAADTASANASKGAGPQFTEQAAKDGRQLFGNKGLGCVNCHGVLGNKSLGMPAPDLTSVHDRLTYPWYSKLMHDPASINPGTRMPAFWTGDTVAFKEIAGGTPQGQIDAMWAYMSLGRSMALPAGLQPVGGQDELIPTDQPIVHRTFMAELGTRAIAVGFPEQLSVAFDANQVRLAETWRGRFFDAKGMWEGRGGNALGPLGTDVLKMPPGPAFATLASGNDPWPEAKPDPHDGDVARNTGGHFKGYALDKDGRPTFHYTLGDVDIHEQPLPVLKPGGATLTRRFTVSSKEPARDLYFQAAAGNKIESKSPGVWMVDDKVTVRIVPGDGMEKLEPVIRDEKGGRQLVVPVPVKGSASFDLEVSW